MSEKIYVVETYIEDYSGRTHSHRFFVFRDLNEAKNFAEDFRSKDALNWAKIYSENGNGPWLSDHANELIIIENRR